MIRALFDVPQCLNLEACFVGKPSSGVAIGNGWMRAWDKNACGGGTAAFRQRAAHECLDTVAVLRAYREPLEGETWLMPAGSEERLLAQVNAIIALGHEAVRQVASMAIDEDVPDPGRVFASLLVLGCVEGRAWLKAMRDTFVVAVMRHPAESAAAVEALSLSPNLEVAIFVEPLLFDERPRVRAAAVRVLAYREALVEAAWQAATRDGDAGVLAAAACAPLRGYDRDASERALQPLLEHDNEAVVSAALRAGLSLRLTTAHSRAAEIARRNPTWAGAAHCLAMFGVVTDARLIRALIEGPHWLHGVRAAATLGSVSLVPDLLAVLKRADLAPQQAADVKSALFDITGLPFASVDWADHTWQLWKQRSSAFHVDARYRTGHPLNLKYLLEALKAPPGSRNTRQDSYLEMMVATESHVPRFSTYDFVGVQTASIRRIEQWLGDSPDRRSVAHLLH